MILTADELGAEWSPTSVEYDNETGWVQARSVNNNDNWLTITVQNYTSRQEALDTVYDEFERMTYLSWYSGNFYVTNVTVENGTDSSFMFQPINPSYTHVMLTKGNIVVDVRMTHKVYHDRTNYVLQICENQASKIE